tara:strand:+ start:129 stop:539 length:411 start_codon:yes stop_codon:yes gene_type:complete
MDIHVLLYESGKENEGIHSIEIKEKTVILMFEEIDDADRYCGLLEAQDFPVPSVELVDRTEIEQFCKESGYDARFVPRGFIPETDEDRLLISPPQNNVDITSWSENNNQYNLDEMIIPEKNLDNIEDLKKRLEDLL